MPPRRRTYFQDGNKRRQADIITPPPTSVPYHPPAFAPPQHVAAPQLPVPTPAPQPQYQQTAQVPMQYARSDDRLPVLSAHLAQMMVDYRTLQQELMEGRAGETQVTMLLYKGMRDNLLELSREADALCRGHMNEKTIYALLQLNKQIVELSNDIRRMEDFTAQLSMLQGIVTQPGQMIAQYIITELQPMIMELRTQGKGELVSLFESRIRAIFAYVAQVQAQTAEQVSALFRPII